MLPLAKFNARPGDARIHLTPQASVTLPAGCPYHYQTRLSRRLRIARGGGKIPRNRPKAAERCN